MLKAGLAARSRRRHPVGDSEVHMELCILQVGISCGVQSSAKVVAVAS